MHPFSHKIASREPRRKPGRECVLIITYRVASLTTGYLLLTNHPQTLSFSNLIDIRAQCGMEAGAVEKVVGSAPLGHWGIQAPSTSCLWHSLKAGSSLLHPLHSADEGREIRWKRQPCPNCLYCIPCFLSSSNVGTGLQPHLHTRSLGVSLVMLPARWEVGWVSPLHCSCLNSLLGSSNIDSQDLSHCK